MPKMVKPRKQPPPPPSPQSKSSIRRRKPIWEKQFDRIIKRYEAYIPERIPNILNGQLDDDKRAAMKKLLNPLKKDLANLISKIATEVIIRNNHNCY
jgi:hypothetical protein